MEKIIEAMQTLKDTCNRYRTCEDCPLSDPDRLSTCGIWYRAPRRWEPDKVGQKERKE